MEPEQAFAQLKSALAQGFRQFLGALVSFRTFCQMIAFLASMIGGWLRPILYRDAGERALRGSVFALIFGLVGWGLFCEVWETGQSLFGHVRVGGSRIWSLAALWSAGLAAADWRAALNRRNAQTFLFSRFLGWPRLLPAAVVSYTLPLTLVFLAGLILEEWQLDVPGGIMLMGSAAALRVQLWTVAALRREDAMDLLDANWLSEDRSQASETLSGSATQGAADEAVARAATTADLVRRFSL